MTKKEVISQIRQVYVSHVAWKNAVQKTRMDFYVLRKDIDLSPADCSFGKWYYGEGQYLNQLDSFKKLESLHDRVHHILQTIFKLSLREEMSEGKLVLKSTLPQLKVSEQKIVNAYCKDFINANKNFSQAIKELYMDVVNMPEVSFNEDTLLRKI